MQRRLMSNRPLQVLLVALVALATVGSAFAWQTVISSFEHSSRYGGEANNGNRTGAVEYSGSERRIRAGADNISFTAGEINWNRTQGYAPAEVFHVSPKNQAGGNCTMIRAISGWNWTNLPGPSISYRGCGDPLGSNEVRFYYDPNSASTTTTYYIQSLYRDLGYGSSSGKAVGQIGLDSYATYLGARQYIDFHGKVCINPDTTYSPTGGSC